MATQVDSHSDMAHARQSDGINVIFDQKSPGSSRSRSRSVSSTASSQSTGSGYRREIRRGRYRSSSRSSSSSSSRSRSSSRSGSRSRSRSYPRCHRRSSCCRCDDHRSYGGDRYRRSPPRRYRAHSRSYSRSPSRRYRGGSRSYSRSPPRRYRVHSRSPSSDRYSRHRRNYRSRSRSWSPVSWSRYRRPVSQLRCRFSRSPSRTYRGRSRSRSSGRSVSLSVHDKRELLEVAKANAMRMLGVEKLDLPESVKPILSDKPEARGSSPEPFTRVRHGSQKIEIT
ncbi:arginine/serine-rich protein 1 isoform X2 [Girardinichthys multiradiatus]|uniref:arginine/serine-rich protein 1 isoform X2 n=1 Tax=Girardinichthys multiradiatus TaxID=208333 RepID=UPI001FAD90CF|nr:arginine/serine-rich protein 1 isoform X2 [Girardinichthys multiradiatus]